MPETARRAGKELVIATRPYAEESRGKTWRLLLVTLAALLASLTAAALVPWWPLRLAMSVVGALVMVRAFIFFHDYQHGAIFRGSRLAAPVVNAIGLLMLVPPRSWKESHNYHHANVARVDTPAIGSYPLMSVSAWRRASRWERFQYRASRHPGAMLAAALTIFLINITLVPLLRSPRRYWDSALAVVLNGGLIATLWLVGGADVAFFAFVLPWVLSTALGAYLFYAQHNFPGVRLLAPEAWSYSRAALESSSYLRMGRVLRWLTGDIGYHHVHHLNPAIPFYRLAETMAALPELQQPRVTTFWPRDVRDCFRANVWDERAEVMVSYRAVREEKPRHGSPLDRPLSH